MRLLVRINLTVAYAAYADHWRHAYVHPTLLTHETNLGQTPWSYDVRAELQRRTLSHENPCGLVRDQQLGEYTLPEGALLLISVNLYGGGYTARTIARMPYLNDYRQAWRMFGLRPY